MADAPFNGLRVWGEWGDGESPAFGVTTPKPDDDLRAIAYELARRETLRITESRYEAVEMLSPQWFRDLQSVRHQRQGHWMAKLLEFGRHAGERVLGLGCGLGSDLVCYAAAGAEVIAACASTHQRTLVKRNFESRNLPGVFLHASVLALPLESSSIDVVNITGLLHETDPGPVVNEIYRVLKPGGKLIAILPARYNVDFWWPYFAFGQPREPEEPNPLLHAERRFTVSEIRQLFGRFIEMRLHRRHLRRGEVPHLYRWLPLSVLERALGRLLVVKALKPVSSAISEQIAA